jgi:hypothetical protein
MIRADTAALGSVPMTGTGSPSGCRVDADAGPGGDIVVGILEVGRPAVGSVVDAVVESGVPFQPYNRRSWPAFGLP